MKKPSNEQIKHYTKAHTIVEHKGRVYKLLLAHSEVRVWVGDGKWAVVPAADPVAVGVLFEALRDARGFR